MAFVQTRTIVFSLMFFALLITLTQAKDILVGGREDAWKIPSSQSDSLNQWAQSSRFRIGDSLVWKYDGAKDSVLQVTKGDYLSCNASSPIEEYKDGNTKVELEKSGPFYFISGAKGHCEQGQKLLVVVLSTRHNGHSVSSPAPSPAEGEGPTTAPRPTSGGTSLKGAISMVALGILVKGLFC